MTNVVDVNLADTLVSNAVEACAGQKFGGDTRQVHDALHLGRCDICEIFRDHLVSEIGKYLGEMDRTVKAIVRYEPESPSLNPSLPNFHINERGPVHAGGINLIAWVDRKSAALSALTTTLETTLGDARRKLSCPNALPTCFILDLQMVEDREVLDSRGFGLVFNRPFLRSIKVWQREDVTSASTMAISDRLREVLPGGLLTPLDLELAPEALLINQARAMAQVAGPEQRVLEPRMREVKAILIRRLISDQLAYINIAKDWLDIDDLDDVYTHRIGPGKIGGKAAGLLLAASILRRTADAGLQSTLHIPTSLYLGSDLIYVFMAMNGLMHWNNQKYKAEELIHSEYPSIKEEFSAGQFPPEVIDQLRQRLSEIGHQPVIVRSSSQLEDNFGTSFAGKYQSFFCPNQDTLEENLSALTKSIALIYASTLNPDALLYRRRKGLQDYDERMAVLIQPVQGQPYGRYYLPFGAGVAFSRNLYRWAEQIRLEDGFARLVWGLGTHAVERGGNDYPRLVALSHPALQPDDETRAIRYYSQKYVDAIDLQENTVKTLPVHDLLNTDYPPLRHLVQVEEDGYFSTPRRMVMSGDLPNIAVTFDGLLRRTSFATNLSRILKVLENHYRVPVDIEFTLDLTGGTTTQPGLVITLLQCRPQSYLQSVLPGTLPTNLDPKDILFSSQYMVPMGFLSDIRYVIYISPENYFALASEAERYEVSRVVAQLNALLPPKTFICIGPGRWGTNDLDLGVFVNYADVYNTGALIELSGGDTGVAPESSFGTHFFQDLMEAQIYPLALLLSDHRTVFNRAFFENAPNRLTERVNAAAPIQKAVRLIDINQSKTGAHLELYLDGNRSQAIAYLVQDK